jgi:type I restriction enzyme R subunit/putative DNA methylase
MFMPSRSKREHLRCLVEDKNQWSRPLTDKDRALGFLGWHERGYLPHCDFPYLVQLVTFRLEDSMPAARRGEWEHLLEIEDVRERRTKLEEYLDRGVGDCLLRDERFAKIAEDALLHFHNDRYELLAWCVMPNHVHVLMDVRMTPLHRIVQNWKIHFENQARNTPILERWAPCRRESISETNEPGRCPALHLKWQREYWDTFMRDAAQERKAVHYIEHNPVKAKLCVAPADWPFSSARYRDEYRRLVMPAKLKTVK